MPYLIEVNEVFTWEGAVSVDKTRLPRGRSSPRRRVLGQRKSSSSPSSVTQRKETEPRAQSEQCLMRQREGVFLNSVWSQDLGKKSSEGKIFNDGEKRCHKSACAFLADNLAAG